MSAAPVLEATMVAREAARAALERTLGRPAKRVLVCTVCGEAGHRSDNQRHTGPKAPRDYAWPTCSACGDQGHRSNSPHCRMKGRPDAQQLVDGEPTVVIPSEPVPAPELAAAAPAPAVDDQPLIAVERLLSGRMHSHTKTISAGKAFRGEREAFARDALDELPPVERPRTRGDCAGGPRPCPWVSCAFHLYLDVNPESGSIRLNHPHLEVDQLPETCALDAADHGGLTLDQVGTIIGLTRERIRQIEVRGLAKLKLALPETGEADIAGPALRHPLGEVAR